MFDSGAHLLMRPPCSTASGGIASLLQSPRLMAVSLGRSVDSQSCAPTQYNRRMSIKEVEAAAVSTPIFIYFG